METSAKADTAADPRPALRQAAELHRQGRLREAETLYYAILRAHPGYFDALHSLGVVRLQMGEAEPAVELIRQALALNPRSVEAYNNLGGALQALNRHEEAVAPYRQALALKPDFADAHNNLGAALKSLGRLDEAAAEFDAAVALAPGRAAFYRNLVDSRRITPDDPALAAMEALAGKMAGMPQSTRIQLHFALGKAYADTGRAELSFRHLLQGNALRRSEIVYDEGNTLRLFERTRAAFTADLLRSAPVGATADRPVFIVGMPRSGTSLVEQILASHPAVFGAGELTEFETLAMQLAAPGAAASAFPERAARLGAAGFRRLGESYRAVVDAVAPDALRVTDKMPANFRHLGLIRLALPNARIIHVRRDPVDTCLSCFSILFMGHQPFAYDLGELGRYYRGYDRLMAHWRAALPAGIMLELRYEDLVADLEREARRMVAHCGLDWDPACLDFNRTVRPVRTASAVQVRQPLYRSSIGRWRPPPAVLRPLLNGLGAELAAPA